jgi:peptidoglycan/xylan/chitin deacetylase (PgdA/CDA1 family)
MEGVLKSDKPLYVFSSHFHEDHFTRVIFEWKKQKPNVTYILSKDILRHRRLTRERYKMVMWDLVTRDYSKWLTAEDVVNNVKRYARNGSIITFHDSLKAIEKLRTALPQSIEWLKEQGYAFKVIPDPKV